MRALFRLALASGALLSSCASPPAVDPASGTVWGRVLLAPRKGAPTRGSASYADRSLHDVEFIDYASPGFAVVYVEGPPAPAHPASLTLGPEGFQPPEAALGAGSELVITNRDTRPHAVSCPEAGILGRLGPGESVKGALSRPGPSTVFALDLKAEARLFVSPGPFAVVSRTGRFELRGLAPGRGRLKAWHPRLPSSSAELTWKGGDVLQAELTLGVAVLGEGSR